MMRTSLLAAAVLMACGNGSMSPVVPLSGAGEAYASAFCGRLTACCTAPEMAVLFPGSPPPVTDEPSCVAHVRRVFGNEFTADAEHAEEQGWAVYHGDRMASCLEHLREDGCDHLARVFFLTTLPADCETPLEPRVQVGGECDHDFQCIDGYCSGSTAMTTGTCAPMPGIGEPCENACEAGAFCEGSPPDRRCQRLGSVGETCTSRFQCETFACDASGRCADVTSCDGA